MQNEFDKEEKYKLFRTVREILHPSISKKNISNYRIIITEDLLPLRIHYPKKVGNIEKVIIYIHGNGEVTGCRGVYSNILKNISIKTNSLVIAIEYDELKHKYNEMYQSIYNIVKYLYKELERNNIDNKNICLMGDSTGCNIITGINYLNNKTINIKKEILFYPTLSLDYFNESKYESIEKNKDLNFKLLDKLQNYYTYISYKKDLKDKLLNPLKTDNYKTIPETMIIVGNVDILKDEANDYYNKIMDNNKNNIYYEIPFLSHGFLKKLDNEVEDELFNKINDYLK